MSQQANLSPSIGQKDWREARTVTAGIDIGSSSAQAVIFADDEICCYSSVRTGANSERTAWKALNAALEGTGLTLDNIQHTVATGYGRVIVPFAQKNLTEIACHARGAHWFLPGVRTVLDMGGQDCKAIRCDENGKVTQFLLNDKCAAGTGRSMEIMAEIMEISLDEIGPRSLSVDGQPKPVSSTCVVFARSEALTLLRRGMPVNEILAAYCDALARRIFNLIQRIGMEEEFVISGGIAKNQGVVSRITERFGVRPQVCFEPQLVGAVGAALFARALLERRAR